jgi:hypothetical protein
MEICSPVREALVARADSSTNTRRGGGGEEPRRQAALPSPLSALEPVQSEAM